MQSKLPLLALLVFTSITTLIAQVEGDNLFAENQVATIELDFYADNFYNTLVSNYSSGTYILADVTITDNTGTTQIDSVGVRLKGNSSYNHPGTKKSFKIDFNRFVAGVNYDGLKKLNFNNGFKDPSLIREKVFFDLCKQAGVLAPRSNFANVYFNGELWGFYTMVEQIDDQFLDWAIEEDNGNLFKAGDNFSGNEGAADLQHYGDNQSSYTNRYELKSNEEEDDWSDLIDLIDFIDNSSDAEFETQLASRIDLIPFLRSMALNNLFSNLDTYNGSARNYYIYHNLDTDKWEWIKWDGNECFGSYANGVNGIETLDLDYHNSGRPLLERVFESESLYQLYLEQVCEITENYFNPSYMNALIDEVKAIAEISVYADNDKMFTNAQFETNIESNLNLGGGPGGGTYYGLKSFVQNKHSFIEGEIDCEAILGVEEVAFMQATAYPNPSNGWIQIESQSDMQRVQVVDLTGKILIDERAQNRMHTLDLSQLAQGMYVLHLMGEEGNWSQSILVE